MGVFLTIFLVFVGAILLLLLLLAVLPVRYEVKMDYQPGAFCAEGSTGLWRVFGAVFKVEPGENKFCFSIAGIPLSSKKGKDDKERGEPKKKKSSKFSLSKGLGALTDRLFRDQVFCLGKDIIAIIKPQTLLVDGRIGFSEPHYTAWLMASTEAFRGFCPNEVIQLEPVWDEEYIEMHVRVAGSFILVVILIRVIRFFLNRSVRTRIKLLRAETV
ncbi:MAG: hypothetical protein U9N81_12530 [Bacillota bacterium]|nr:hypothetical protein [Bacillota bacterium]